LRPALDVVDACDFEHETADAAGPTLARRHVRAGSCQLQGNGGLEEARRVVSVRFISRRVCRPRCSSHFRVALEVGLA
jgi:hypothetical protein